MINMDKVLKERLERAESIARSLPPPKDELKRRTYFVGKTKRIFHPYPIIECPFNVEYY